jgi:hypothetical protein
MGELTAVSISASGKTGGLCSASGPYRSGRSPYAVIFFKKGDKFTGDVDGRSTTWTLLKQ